MRKFTLIEIMVVVVIFFILAGMFLPALHRAREISRSQHAQRKYGISSALTTREYRTVWRKWRKSYGKTYPDISKKQAEKLQDMVSAFGEIGDKEDKYKAEAEGEIVADISKESLYDQWVRRSGNEKELTEHEFEVLLKEDMIKELKYLEWKRITGRRKISSKEYELLREKGLIRLYY